MKNITKVISYQNGDYLCTLHSDGTLIRETNIENPRVEFPCSIDVKITNFCDMGCSYCHESSTLEGKHGDLDALLEVLDLPAGIELAIGGGNPLSHPRLVDFLIKVKKRGWIANLTVNQGHLKPYFPLIKDLIEKDLIKGLGISIINKNYKYIHKLQELTPHLVYHVILGIVDEEVFEKLKGKFLILGYKQFGFGVDFFNDELNEKIKHFPIRKYLGKIHLSFDNLAIEQLNLKKHLTVEAWDAFYMGDDFQFTMYIDAVEKKFAPTSRSKERTDYQNLKEYFNGKKVS